MQGLTDTLDPLLCGLAQPLDPFTMGKNVVRIAHEFMGDRARPRAIEGEVEAGVPELPRLTSGNDEECSGGETRTLNLAVNSRLLCH